ncbi:TPA: TIGR00730 family Rossman fold protein [Patescibacteria group bacterium]|nr:TIGR00730 family Rossman fold protein [Patescibacteria group bacterium]
MRRKAKSPKPQASPLPGSDRIDQLLAAHEHEETTWRIFKIISEFVKGFEFLRKYKRAASIYGSSRLHLKNHVYREAQQLARALSKMGFTIITGGGPGVMEAANHGAYNNGGQSVGINIEGIFGDERRNKYVKEGESFQYFFTRKVMLSFASQLYIFFPGGFGTLDELFEMITLVQTKKIPPVPIILIDKHYWQPLISWIDKTVYGENKAVEKNYRDYFYLVDSAEEAVKLIKKLMSQKKIPFWK